MGGSLALALRNRCQSLLGCDRDADVLEIAQQQNLYTKLSRLPEEVIPEADVVILATPLNSILQLIKLLPELHPGSPVVLDLGSTKVEVNKALENLPTRFDPLGGHPMCGKEVGGIKHADPKLYEGTPFVFTKLDRTSGKAQEFAAQLADAIGAYPLWLEPELHDQWAAATSHLPYLVASALAGSTPSEVKPLVGSGFRSTTRIAATPPVVMMGVMETNRENILGQLRIFQAQLQHYQELLSAGDFSALEAVLDEHAAKQRLLVARQEVA
jgi:prephenate dehydrogenase